MMSWLKPLTLALALLVASPTLSVQTLGPPPAEAGFITKAIKVRVAGAIIGNVVRRTVVRKGVAALERRVVQRIEAKAAGSAVRGFYPQIEARLARSINPQWKRIAGYQENCGNCSITFANRLRGVNASAAPGVPTTMNQLAEHAGSTFSQLYPRISPIIGKMNGAGNGAQGIVYGSRADGTAHFFNALNRNGKIVFWDAQSGTPAVVEGFKQFSLMILKGK